jgi:hypothetical protein
MGRNKKGELEKGNNDSDSGSDAWKCAVKKQNEAKPPKPSQSAAPECHYRAVNAQA